MALPALTNASSPDDRNARWLALVMQARGGDGCSFDALYACTAPWLLRFVRRMVGPDDAEDVLAETYIQAWRELDRFDPERAPVAVWLIVIARTRALDHLRRVRRRQSSESDAMREGDALASTEGTDPESCLAHAQELRLLELQFQAGLSDEERTVLALAYFEGLTQSEIAARLAMPLGTVKTRMTRAQQRLRRMLACGAPNLSHGASSGNGQELNP
jgi:RNA polymerase sigma-70 factor (ECF subfamily)